jgi:XTP/dITP diphosphohydrolase
VLTLLLSSSRVAPGLLSWPAWSVLHEASRVLAGSAEHPLIPALAEAGIAAEVVDSPGDDDDARASFLTDFLTTAVADAGGPVVWLLPPGAAEPAALLDSLSAAAEIPVRVMHGSRDLPGAHLLDVVAIMDRLRVSCPWDREQTHASLLKYLLEETYEAAEAIETSDWPSLREELGDVLFQAVFHARVAAERTAAEGGFTIDDVADELAAKLVRRHPHVFASVAVSSADEVNQNWEEIKKAEKAKRAEESGSGPASVLDGVAFGQPALSLAAQLQRRAARAGAPAATGSGGAGSGSARSDTAGSGGAGSAGGLDADGIGDELMRAVARARAAGVDPEIALREAARRYAESVHEWERSAG